MAQDFEVKITGERDILDRMSKLPDDLQKKGAVAAARKAMRIVVNSARAQARGLDDPNTKESIAKNIVSQNSPRGGRRIGGVVMRVGVRGGAQFSEGLEASASGNPGGYTWYWRFLELGTKRISAAEFLANALGRNAQAVESALAAELEVQLAKLTPKA